MSTLASVRVCPPASVKTVFVAVLHGVRHRVGEIREGRGRELDHVVAHEPGAGREVDDEARLERRVEDEPVVAGVALEVVAAGAGKQRVVAVAADEDVVAGAGAEVVVAVAADDGVVAVMRRRWCRCRSRR